MKGAGFLEPGEGLFPVAGALGVILVRDRRAEERHDAFAGEFVDETLAALDAVGEEAEEALHDLRPRFGIELFRQLHRSLHVGEEHGHLLALAFEGGLRLPDLLGEVLGGLGSGAALHVGVAGSEQALGSGCVVAEAETTVEDQCFLEETGAGDRVTTGHGQFAEAEHRSGGERAGAEIVGEAPGPIVPIVRLRRARGAVS